MLGSSVLNVRPAQLAGLQLQVRRHAKFAQPGMQRAQVPMVAPSAWLVAMPVGRVPSASIVPPADLQYQGKKHVNLVRRGVRLAWVPLVAPSAPLAVFLQN
jgi:hypothetical protein